MYKLSEQTDYKGQIFTEPSQTVPDQTMSIRTILEKYARGENLTGKQPSFHGETLMPELKSMDLTEIQELYNQNADNIQNMRNDLLKTQQQRQKDLEEQKFEQEIGKRLQSRAKQTMESNNDSSEKASQTA